MIREILVGQLTEPGQQANGGLFFGRAVGFLGAIAPVLTWMRDEKGIQLDLEKIRDATELSNVVLLATKKQIKFTDSATGTSELLEFPDMPAALVQTLLKDGHVEMSPSPADRRASIVRLTPSGRSYFADLADAHHGWIDAMLAGLGRSEREALYNLLGALKASIGQAEEAA